MTRHVRSIHDIWVAPAFGGDGRKTERWYQPECSCGWKGSPHSSAAWAHRDFRRHVNGPIVEVPR